MKTVNYNNNPTTRLDSRQESVPSRLTGNKIRMMEELQTDLPTPKAVRRVVYDFRVNQIELAIHNQELRTLQQGLEVSKMRFKDLCDFAPASSITVNDQGVFVEGTGMQLAEEKKQLEAKCRDLEKVESLSRMAGAIAHHFNNLLGAVMGNLELAQNGIAKETESSNNSNSTMHAAKRAAEICSSMLTCLGQTSAQREQLDFAATFRTCLAGLQAVMPKEVDMAIDFPADGPSVNGKSYQVHQVLNDLMNNAWESQSRHRGTIHLSMKIIKPEDIPAKYRLPLNFQFQNYPYACLTVHDVGCGIAEPDIENLFDPFYTSKFFGRGIGLPIVMGIVRAHSGFLLVTSKGGMGSIFSIFLPVSGSLKNRESAYRNAL